MNGVTKLKNVRTALYVPASNERALAKARGLDADMLVVDLEDSVAPENKASARDVAIVQSREGFGDKLLALRINAVDSPFFEEDLAAAGQAVVDYLVVPKIDIVAEIDRVAALSELPIIAMIESPSGIYNARDVAKHASVAGLFMGGNDLCAETGIRPGPNREGLELALQSVVLAGAASAKPAFDTVYNLLDDMSGFESECRQGRCYGFAGKTLIHPNQVDIANAAFGPDAAELADAQALIDAATGGAQRFRGRMIERMHVEEAKRAIARAMGKTTAA
jgi:(3S)-malyl-CoA thioesterase